MQDPGDRGGLKDALDDIADDELSSGLGRVKGLECRDLVGFRVQGPK